MDSASLGYKNRRTEVLKHRKFVRHVFCNVIFELFSTFFPG